MICDTIAMTEVFFCVDCGLIFDLVGGMIYEVCYFRLAPCICFISPCITYSKGLFSPMQSQILMVNIIISLLHMDGLSLNLTPCASSSSSSESSNISRGQQLEDATHDGRNKNVVMFIGQLLDILRKYLPSSNSEKENNGEVNMSAGIKEAIEWRIMNAKRFIEDWEWRLSILQCLLPFSERQWRWREALTILRAAPSKLLNL